MPKPHRKLIAFNKIYYEYQKAYGFKAANEWLRREWTGELYLHDSDTSTFKSYCFAYTLKDLAEKGLYFLGDGFNPKPPKHLTTFVDFVKEFINFASNRTSGAVGLPDLIPYMYYFWKKDIDNNYLGMVDGEKYARQNIQRFIYAVNQPCVRDGQQSAFTNTSVFDREYLMALFGGSEFPDGKFMVDYIEGIMEFQQLYMEVVDEMFGGSYGGIEFVEWTPKPCRGYFGVYYSGGRIFINSLLNYPSVPREVVKFIIYHELLHRDNPFHNKEFRKNEHKYPGYVEWDRFLDNTFEKFDFDM
jgi:hypothetical protein